MSLNCLDLSYNSFGEVGGIYLAAGLVSLIKTKYSVHGHDDIMLGIHLIWSIICETYVSTHQPWVLVTYPCHMGWLRFRRDNLAVDGVITGHHLQPNYPTETWAIPCDTYVANGNGSKRCTFHNLQYSKLISYKITKSWSHKQYIPFDLMWVCYFIETRHYAIKYANN